jgi:tetratricopeptide (TPR) repeat protein
MYLLLFALFIVFLPVPALTQTIPAGQAAEVDNPPLATAEAPAPLTPERRGDVFMARKMYREAIDTYRQAPMDSAVIWNKIGIAHHQLMDFATARKHYEKAVKLNPKYPEAINNLGAVYYSGKNYGRAIKLYKRALKLSPNSASIHSNLGTAYFARKKYKDAFVAYQMALSLDPEVFEHRSSYGVMLQERNVDERAKFHFYLAKTYAQAGMTERALTEIRKALEEGFKERKRFFEEPEFANLQGLPEFKDLMALQPRVL